MGYAVIGLLVLLALGVPIAYGFGLGAILSTFLSSMRSALFMPTVFQSLDSFTLLAIPFFILAGELMKEGGISVQLMEFGEAIMGKVKACLCYVLIVACVFFGAVSGSSVAAVAAIGSIMVPTMAKKGYDKEISTALIAASGFIGILIPPSIPVVVYAVIAGVSISEAFLSTVFAGLLLAVAYSLVIRLYYIPRGAFDTAERAKPYESTAIAVKTILKKTAGAFPALFMPIIILGGIYGGIFTPTESAAVATVYSVFVGMFLYKGLTKKNIGPAFIRSAVSCAAIMICIAFVTIFGRALMVDEIPNKIAHFILSITDNKYICINLFLLVVGMFMEANVAILILTPIMLPIIQGIGVDPLHFCAILIMNLGIGLITPPYAGNLFVASKATGVPIARFLPHIFRFMFFAAIPVLLLITYIPALSLFLPRLLGG